MRAGALLLMLVGCGRLGFDAVGDGGSAGDGAAALYAEIVVSDGPYSYFRLDEAGGAVARDSSGNGRDWAYLTSSGTFGYGSTGGLASDPNPAVQIDGDGNTGPNVAAHVDVPEIGPVWAGDFTIELLVRPTAPPVGGYNNALFVCEHHLVNGFRFGWMLDRTLEFWTDEAGSTTSLRTTATVTDGVWHHIVLVKRGVVVEIYLDGASAASVAADYQPPDELGECGFGAFHGMPTHGTFDEVAVYDHALSAAQIAGHHAAMIRE